MTPIEPLEASGIALIDAQETDAEKFWKTIPVLGWAVASLLWGRRTQPLVKSIASQLRSRPEPPPHIWGSDPRRVRLGLFLSRVAEEAMGWPNSRFIPADPVDVVFWAHEDGLDLEFAIQRIEKELHIKLAIAEVEGWFGKTLGEVIDHLMEKCR